MTLKIEEVLSLPIDINLLLETIGKINNIDRYDLEVPEHLPEVIDNFNYVNDKINRKVYGIK